MIKLTTAKRPKALPVTPENLFCGYEKARRLVLFEVSIQQLIQQKANKENPCVDGATSAIRQRTIKTYQTAFEQSRVFSGPQAAYSEIYHLNKYHALDDKTSILGRISNRRSHDNLIGL